MDAESFCGSYALTHFNGTSTATTAALHVSRDGNSLKLVAKVANTLRGHVTYEDGRLSGVLMSTMMMGNDEQMAIEDALSGGFGNGFDVRRETDRVLLKNDSNSFVFVKTNSLDDIAGEHAIISINGQAPPEDISMKLIPDGNGGSFVIATVTNTLRGDCRVDGGVLQGDVATTALDTEPHLAAIEQQIMHGLKHGFQVSKNDTGVVLSSDECNLQLYHIVNRDELTGDYLLKTRNGVKVNTSLQCTLSFSPDANSSNQVNISIVVANRIRGTAALEQNLLKSEEPLLSTRMMGSEEESNLETAYNAGFQYGMEVIYRNNELVLKDEDNEFVYARVAVVNATNGEPIYKGTYSCKCFKTQGNGLLFRIINEPDACWAFYNDTKDYRMHVHATFGSRSQIQALNNATLQQTSEGRFVVEVTVEPLDTELFISGEVNGFKIMYNAEPV